MTEQNVPSNGDVARVFERIAGIMEIQGENAFKIRAYRNAVSTLRSLGEPVSQIAAEGRLDSIPGFGEAIQAKIKDILKTGTTPLYERIKDQVPEGVLTILALPGLGAKTVSQLWRELKVESVEALEEAVRSGKVAQLSGMGEKTAQKILDSIERGSRYGGRMLYSDALRQAIGLMESLQSRPEVKRLDYAGSLRRGAETIGDINLTAISTDPEATLAAFTGLSQADKTISRTTSDARIALHGGTEADLYLAKPDEYGAIQQLRTGSQAHNARLAQLGELSSGLGDEETSVYTALGLPYIPPPLREDTGEIEAALAGKLPRLVTEDDFRGDVHAHTTASDGKASIAEMAEAAKARGYEYMAITDHSYSLAIAGGLTPERLREQIKEIRALEDTLGIRVFAGSEVDIKADGTLDFDDDLLSELDFVIASAHLHNRQDEAAQTARLIKAIENPHVDLIAHPTGRLLNRRDPYPLDIEAVIVAAARTHTALEINASPDRLDLKDTYARMACQAGVKIIVNTDAHAPGEYNTLYYGILVAQRAWLEPKDILNTWPLAKFEEWLNR